MNVSDQPQFKNAASDAEIQLVRSNVVDDYVLLIHALVPGSGRRRFTGEGASTALTRRDIKDERKRGGHATCRWASVHDSEKRGRTPTPIAGENPLYWKSRE